ncbi:maleylpyruvate isomerase family mycothiol-dependent enzyme [Cellulomonas sp. C5510]|uniref:maleylpyruvate isomerase family mycothiol-dependent enzyme n=1 Tax=Cellulomonas sp. C5510 TaxID=2871170 RepID=UPI001C9591FC|nr:maleylpyruvate isomerase family mycothiol-dependent enzyme [Cellulomonas sp. C5510]QZN86690.1 maleylpyruvate isomerase family mycothiol-dependent enzyme [Cellulomonas sp. C5510]
MPTRESRAGGAAPAAPVLLDVLAEAQDAFARLLADADPDAPVAACPGWTVTDLVLHLGAVHVWAAGMARGTDSDEEGAPGPREPVALQARYREQAGTLLGTLRALGPDAPGLTLLGPGPASFWHRRQVHETLVHLHDLAAAAGAEHPVTDPSLWADTVDEVVTVMLPRQVRLGRTTLPEVAVRLAAPDAGRTWLLGVAEAGPAAEVAGPSRALALLLWGRTTADDPALRVAGDRAALRAALGRALTP